MLFTPDRSKQAQEVLFFPKTAKTNQPSLILKSNAVQNSPNQRHFGLTSDEKLTFNDYIPSKHSTVNKLTNTLRKIFHYVSRDFLVTIYKSFIRRHLDYADVIFDKPNHATFSNQIELAQHNAALAITGSIRGTFKKKLDQELRFEKMQGRMWFQRLCFFYKILNNQAPGYLFSLLPQPNSHYM